MSKTKRKRLHGKVQKVLKPMVPFEPEKVQISVDEADEAAPVKSAWKTS